MGVIPRGKPRGCLLSEHHQGHGDAYNRIASKKTSKKLLSIGIIYACLLISGFAYSAESDAPTIKDLADQKEAEEKVIKELTDAFSANK